MNKNKIILTIIFSIFFILSIFTYYNIIEQKKYIELKHQQSFEILQQIIDGKIIFFRKNLSVKIKNIVNNNKELKDAILNNDHKRIKIVMNNIFKLLKRENKYTKTLQLISKDSISIYRAHKPDKNGDDLTNFRPIVKYVNKIKRAKYGFEAGLYAIVYRVDIPIFYNNKYFGILEYGVDSNLFINDLTSVSNYIKSAILIDKNILLRFNTYNLNNKKYINISKKYILLGSSKFFQNINIKNIKQDIKFDYKNEHYAPFLYELLSYKGMSTGKILIALNITADEHRYEGILKISIVNLIILTFIIYIIVYYAFNFYEKRIKNLIEHEKRNERILHQQSKMASMGEMIGNIAHQWRQPLSVISTIASGTKVQKEFGTLKDSVLCDYMDMIVKQTQYMSKTIDDFKDFFKSDKKKIDFDLKDTIGQNLVLIGPSFKNNDIEIIKLYDNDIKIHGFQNELTQAILNILNNAKDQLIKMQKESIKVVKIETKIENGFAIIDILDNAGGVPDDIINKIFEPYFTTKHQSQGTGIGLYMTHEIITKHFQGNIIIKNKEIKHEGTLFTGANFRIVIPHSLVTLDKE